MTWQKGSEIFMDYKKIMSTDDFTVISKYTPEPHTRTKHQLESELEQDMIRTLVDQGYEYIKIKNSSEMETNLRKCLEELNKYKFSANEWNRFFKSSIATNDGIEGKTKRIQRDYIQSLEMDDGSIKNIKLIDKKEIHNNKLQVINQFQDNDGTKRYRYDVTILVNGLPLVHCELKRRGISIKEAFHQINRYQQNSFCNGNTLYEYLQIFIISNGTQTKYYSNTVRKDSIQETQKKNKNGIGSFEFTSYWSDNENNKIEDLVDFSKTFLLKSNILKILTKYCVFDVSNRLLVMRPYQISSVEKIINQISIAENSNLWGTMHVCGYIWHTTGSGKTLTSFKAAQLASQLPYVDKVLFLVDRQDLDYQTMREYDRFEKGAANSNKNVKILTNQLGNSNCKIIVTTIQKLSIFCKSNENHSIYGKKVILIYDECHRSQFGIQHAIIKKRFKKCVMFGFTGTPIFSKKSKNDDDLSKNILTTEKVFGRRLHTYTIVNAISDGNVLPFRIDYVNTIKCNNIDKKINDDTILLSPQRIEKIVKYIIDHFEQKTMKNNKGTNYFKFNSIFAVSSIKAAKLYYMEFKKHSHNLKIAVIYSCVPSEECNDNYLYDENSESTDSLSKNDKHFLSNAINDYNYMFNENYDTSDESFSNYYKDVSRRVKNGDIDILIVVNMFLTGFDAKKLNTLWVDKNLKSHGLIQAFSRTNRIFNAVKSYGNIICFRDLRENIEDAISLFGDKNANGISILRKYSDYYYGYDKKDDNGNNVKHMDGYKELVDKLYDMYPLPLDLKLEENQKDFINLLSKILRTQNILKSFDEFIGNEIFSEPDFQDYLSYYNDLYDKYKPLTGEDNTPKDVTFEVELVQQITVNIDYILKILSKNKDNLNSTKFAEEMERSIISSPELRPKKNLIKKFASNINFSEEDILKSWIDFKNKEMNNELDKMIREGYDNRPLSKDTRNIVEKILDNNTFTLSSDLISKILPPFHPTKKLSLYKKAKKEIIEKLNRFYLKFRN